MFTAAKPLRVDQNQHKRLKHLADSGKTPRKTALRAHIVLLAAAGLANNAIARRLSVSRPTVILWRGRFAQAGVAGILKDAPRPGRRKAIGPEVIQRVVEATLHTVPPAATHWSVRTMAQGQGLSRMTVQRIWKQHRLQPHRVENFKFSKDPLFVQKLRDVVGLYLNPPEHALVLSVDEKSLSSGVGPHPAATAAATGNPGATDA
jgi:transposase